MKRIRNYKLIFYLLIPFLIISCRKAFLDAKPDASLVVPSTLEDFQAILDNAVYLNGASPGTFGIVSSVGGPNPTLLETGGDNYYIPDNLFTSFIDFHKNIYLWAKENTYGGIATVPDWSVPYRTVFYSNVVLDGLKKISRTDANATDWDRIRGSALFYRSWAFYQLALTFAPLYEKDKAKASLGIPLRLTSDISEKTIRATLEDTYNQILSDLNQASTLLPNIPLYKTRPSIPATYALLARAYLSIQDYNNAKTFADRCLQVYNKPLLNYNTIASASTYPFPRFNDEVIFSSQINNSPIPRLTSITYARIDSSLYASYDKNDLRKDLYFRLRETNAYSFRGSYDGSALYFFGLATDEMYLILSECYLRLHDVSHANQYLNDLLTTRYKTTNGKSTFAVFTSTSEDVMLPIILNERRKELIARGLRWPDLKRLNTDSKTQVTLTRKVNGQLYQLTPNENRYVWPIPDDVIALTGIAQNPR